MAILINCLSFLPQIFKWKYINPCDFRLNNRILWPRLCPDQRRRPPTPSRTSAAGFWRRETRFGKTGCREFRQTAPVPSRRRPTTVSQVRSCVPKLDQTHLGRGQLESNSKVPGIRGCHENALTVLWERFWTFSTRKLVMAK